MQREQVRPSVCTQKSNEFNDAQDQYVLNVSITVANATGLNNLNGKSHDEPDNHELTESRGPEKGYIEALELRLRDTENLLLQLLPQVSDDQLSTSFVRNPSTEDGNSREPLSGLFARPAKRGTEYWKKFPLDTVQNVRDWQYDCLKNEQYCSTSKGAVLESRMATPSTGTFESRSSKHRASQVDVGLETTELDSSPYPSLGALLPADASSDVTSPTPRLEMRRQSHHLAAAAPPAAQTHTMDTQQPDGPKTDGPSYWSEAPSLTFQDQFLW